MKPPPRYARYGGMPSPGACRYLTFPLARDIINHRVGGTSEWLGDPPLTVGGMYT